MTDGPLRWRKYGPWRALAAAFQFSEDVIEDSVQVAGKGKQGADIVARTRAGQTIHREVAVFQGKPGNLYGRIMEKVAQVKDGDIRHVFIEVTDDVLGQPEARDTIISSARQAQADYLRNAAHDLTVIVVDKAGKQVFP